MGALCFVTLFGVARGLPCPSETPCFDAKCQNSYGVTLVKSNRTFYHKFQMNQKKGGISVMGKVSMPQGKGSQLHNRREYEKIGKPIPDNIDSSKTAENITLAD